MSVMRLQHQVHFTANMAFDIVNAEHVSRRILQLTFHTLNKIQYPSF